MEGVTHRLRWREAGGKALREVGRAWAGARSRQEWAGLAEKDRGCHGPQDTRRSV